MHTSPGEALEKARPWYLFLGTCSLEAQMLLSILGSPHTQQGDVLGPGHRPLPHPSVRDVQELRPRGIWFCLCSSPAVPDGQGRKGRNMACGKFGSAQTLLWLQPLQNLMNVFRDMSCTLSQSASTLVVQDEKTFGQP